MIMMMVMMRIVLVNMTTMLMLYSDDVDNDYDDGDD